MTFETLKDACALCQCNVTENEETVSFKFPEVEISVSRNFHVGSTEAALFIFSGWLKILREVLDAISNNEQNEES